MEAQPEFVPARRGRSNAMARLIEMGLQAAINGEHA
jgi:hypothetical protein